MFSALSVDARCNVLEEKLIALTLVESSYRETTGEQRDHSRDVWKLECSFTAGQCGVAILPLTDIVRTKLTGSDLYASIYTFTRLADGTFFITRGTEELRIDLSSGLVDYRNGPHVRGSGICPKHDLRE